MGQEDETTLAFPADLLRGCIEIGGLLVCDPNRLRFAPGNESPPIHVAFDEISQMRLGGRFGEDANRIDLTLLSGRKITLLVVGRDRIAEAIQAHQGWDDPQTVSDRESARPS